MILVDTSIWVDHLRTGVPQLMAALQAGEVVIHPWVIGELACGYAVLGFASGLWPLASARLRPQGRHQRHPAQPQASAQRLRQPAWLFDARAIADSAAARAAELRVWVMGEGEG